MSDQNGILLTKKQASVIAATLVLLSLLIFIAGYFWGKRSMIAGFTQKTSQESFNDQVDYLLTMQSFATKHGAALPEDDLEEQQELLPSKQEDELLTAPASVGLLPTVGLEVKQSDQETAVKISKDSGVTKGPHFALLAGFAKKVSALGMVNRLKKYKIDVELKTKISKSASGKSSKTWYQVVTKKYGTVEEVEAIVDRVASIEHIKRKDIKIV